MKRSRNTSGIRRYRVGRAPDPEAQPSERDVGIGGEWPTTAPLTENGPSTLHRRDSRLAEQRVAMVFAVVLLVLAVAPAPARSQETLDPDDIRRGVSTSAPPATVKVWNRPVATLRATIGHVTPARRAKVTESKFEALPYEKLGESVESELAQVGELRGMLVFIGTEMMFALLKEDLDPLENTTLEEAGQEAVDRIQAALRARAEAQRLPVLLRGIGVSVAATLAFAMLVWGIVRARHWMLRHLGRLAERRRLYAFGVDVCKGVSVFAGLMITLGSAGLVNQVMSGLVAVYARALRPGDVPMRPLRIGLARSECS